MPVEQVVNLGLQFRKMHRQCTQLSIGHTDLTLFSGCIERKAERKNDCRIGYALANGCRHYKGLMM
jgi:hypothetical protein